MKGPNGPVHLVVTDLDGTLWDRDGTIEPSTLDAIVALQERGIGVLAATARRRRSTVERLDSYGLSLPMVLLDGSLGWDPRGASWFHRRSFDRADAAYVLGVFDRAGAEPCVNVGDGRDIVVGPSPSSHPDNLAYLSTFCTYGDLEAVVGTSEVLSFQVYGVGYASVAPVAGTVNASGRAVATVHTDIGHGGHACTVRPVGADKWSGVLSYCAAAGIDPAWTVAVGDGENDVEMLSRAGWSCAPAGASRAALEAAAATVAATGLGGWAQVAWAVLRQQGETAWPGRRAR